MINLLPDNDKREIRAARSNVMLLRYNFLLFGVAAFILVSGLIVYALLSNSKNAAEVATEANTSRAAQYATTRTQADEYRKNLSTAQQILDNEVIYTDLVFEITKLLPTGVILNNLDLDAKEFGTATLISASVKDFTAVEALKQSFEKSAIMSDVHFQTITNTAVSAANGQAQGSSAQNSAYPISVSISVTLNKVAKQ